MAIKQRIHASGSFVLDQNQTLLQSAGADLIFDTTAGDIVYVIPNSSDLIAAGAGIFFTFRGSVTGGHKVTLQADINGGTSLDIQSGQSFVLNVVGNQYMPDIYTAASSIIPKVYKALISQDAPVASQTIGTVPVGSIWSITTYNAGDDFSNWNLISGTENTTGAVYQATTTAPTVWTHGSDLAYDGAPYVVSTDINGSFNPWVNTIGNIVFTYVSPGYFLGTLPGAFDIGKVNFYNTMNLGFNTNTVQYDALGDGNSIEIQSLQAGVATNGVLAHTPINIEVNP